MDRLRGRARDHDVGSAPYARGARRAAGERRPGDGQRLGDDHPAQKVRPAGVGVGVVHRRDRVVSRAARAPALGVGRLHDADRTVRRRAIGRGRQHGHVVAEGAEMPGHRGRPLRPRVGARRVEVRDEEELHRLRRAAIAPS